MIKHTIIAAALVASVSLAGCDPTPVTAAICADAATLKGSTIALNANETLGLNGILTSCASTAGGTVFNNGTVALTIINGAVLLQSSGLLSDVHITAQVPADQKVLKHIKLDADKWAKLAK